MSKHIPKTISFILAALLAVPLGALLGFDLYSCQQDDIMKQEIAVTVRSLTPPRPFHRYSREHYRVDRWK